MILKLEINKLAAGIYAVHCEGYVASPTSHDSIAAALTHYGEDIPPEFARFVEVHYGGVSLGTTPVSRLTQEPEVMARELTALLSDVYRANEEMKAMTSIESRPFVRVAFPSPESPAPLSAKQLEMMAHLQHARR